MCASQALAATPRCGTDDFGNAVCMDKEGVVSTVPPDRFGSDDKDSAASAVSAGDAAGKARRGDKRGQARCGVDPFGNHVCRP